MVTLTDNQKHVLDRMRGTLLMSSAQAGEVLSKAGLLTTRGLPSNWCLAGASVLRSLESRGLVRQFVRSPEDMLRKRYSLTDKGQAAAEGKL